MGKAKRFNSYDSDVKERRKVVQSYGGQRQRLSINSSFRGMPLEPPIATTPGGSGGTGTGTGDGKFATASLAADQTTNIAATDHIEFDTLDEDGGIVLQTGSGQADGIFELSSGKKYFLSALLRPEFSGVNGQLVIAWYDITNAAEIGSRAIYESQTNASHNANQPSAEATITPTANITVHLRIIAVTDLTALANEYCVANLFEIALGGSGTGSAGADGADGTNGADGADGAAGGTGTSISAALSADQTANKAVGDHIEFDVNTPDVGQDGGIVLQTGAGQLDGIFELKQDITYYLSGVANAQFSATNHVELVWYDITNGNELGKRSIQDDTALTIEQSKCEIIFTPTTDVTVELRIVAVTTSGNLTGFESDFTFASIFEFVDTAAGSSGGSIKNSVRLRSKINVNTASCPVTQDGKVLAVGNRILLTTQTTASQNGIWEVTSISGNAVLGRPVDFAAGSTVGSMTMVSVSDGQLMAGTTWVLTTLDTITIDTTGQSWKNILKSSESLQTRMGSTAQISSQLLDLRRTVVFTEWGNYYKINNIGSTCDGIKTAGWQPGAFVILTGFVSGSSNTWKHDQTPVAGMKPFFMAGSVDASFTINDTFMFVYDGTYWREVSRSIA